ncbi:MAG: helix-turn-helix transcriptional regulator [bacterium]|nr:helix-turn-helix transcriptional regulator [bacterium]
MINDKPVRISYSDLVGSTITYLRETRGREVGLGTRAALAKSIGITPGPYGKLEFGKTVCTVSHLFRIAESLQLSPSEILVEADKHVAAIKANPGLKLEGHFEAESPSKIDDDISKNGMRVPRGLVLWFVLMGHRSWQMIDAIFTPIINAFEQLESDQDLQNNIADIVNNHGGKIRWIDYENFVDEYYETSDAKRSYKEIIQLRSIRPDGLEDSDVDELKDYFTNVDWNEYREFFMHSLAANTLKKKRSQKLATLAGDVLAAVNPHSK